MQRNKLETAVVSTDEAEAGVLRCQANRQRRCSFSGEEHQARCSEKAAVVRPAGARYECRTRRRRTAAEPAQRDAAVSTGAKIDPPGVRSRADGGRCRRRPTSGHEGGPGSRWWAARSTRNLPVTLPGRPIRRRSICRRTVVLPKSDASSEGRFAEDASDFAGCYRQEGRSAEDATGAGRQATRRRLPGPEGGVAEDRPEGAAAATEGRSEVAGRPASEDRPEGAAAEG